METKEKPRNTEGLLPLAVALWLGYLLLLLVIDQVFYPRPVFPLAFYLLNATGALAAGGLAWWVKTPPRLRRLTPIVTIGLLAVLPIALGRATPGTHPGPRLAGTPEAVLLRIMPLLLIPLILTAWQYGWQAVLLYSGSTALLAAAFHFTRPLPPGASWWPPFIVLLIQTVTFLVVGYFLSRLIHQLRQQQAELQEAHARLVDYTATLEQLAVSRERNRMARELHDTLAHSLSALSVQLETLKAYWDVEPETARALLDEALNATRAGLNETRRALKALRASPLDDLGLLLALRKLAEQAAERGRLTLHLNLPEHLPPLAPAVEQTVYRVAQEALENVVRHAGARNLYLSLEHNGPDLTLTIADDGVGFDPQQVDGERHFGLRGMRERAAMVGGSLTVTSHSGEGTRVQLRLSEEGHDHPRADL